jgi:hypothetical protein
MKTDLKCWIGPIVKAKQAAKAAGLIKGDVDLAEIVTDMLGQAGLPGKINRAGLNHWMTGRRQPTMAQFLALCEALGISPAEVFDRGVTKTIRPLPEPIKEVVSIMENTDETGQVMALGGIKAALANYQPRKKEAA